MEAETKHRGVDIVFRDYSDKWRASELDIENVSLAALKKQIDEWAKGQIENKTAIVSAWGAMEVVTVTSQTSDGLSFWVKTKSGRREKRDKRSVFKDCPENHAILDEVAAIENEKRRLSNAADAKNSKLIPFSID